MTDVPKPLELEAQSTVEAYLEECSSAEPILERVAVLHHREEYFRALEVVVDHRKRLLTLDGRSRRRRSD